MAAGGDGEGVRALRTSSDRAASPSGLSPASGSSQSGIASAGHLTALTLVTMLADYDRIASRDFHDKYPFFRADHDAAHWAGEDLRETTWRLFKRYAKEVEARGQ